MTRLASLLFHLCTSAAVAGAAPRLSAAQASWQNLAPVPIGALHEHSTVAFSASQIAIIGGVLERGGVIDTVLTYDIPANTWKRVASLPIIINHANAAVVDGKVYVLGGMTGASWAGTGRSWVYEPTADKWTALPSMPTGDVPRGSAAMGVYNKTIWLASGKTSGTGGKSVSAVSAFDTITGTWRTDLPPAARNIPEARDHGGGVVIGTKFYQIAGSLDSIPNRKDTVFVLDLENLAQGWTTTKGRMPTPRRGIAVAAIGKKIYTFGGEGNPDATSRGVFNEVEVYDTTTDAWETLGSMPIPRHGSYAVEVEGKIYIPAGGTATGTPATAAFDVFTP